MLPKLFGLLLTVHCVKAFEANCSSKFSDLGYSISTVICPAGCWQQSHSLCGTGTYGDGPVCLAAIHAGVISECGGVAHVYETSGRGASSGSYSNTIRTSSCKSKRIAYSFQMTCSTTGNTEFVITKVTCPSNCQSSYVCGSGFYTSNSSVCAAAIHSGVLGTPGGQMRFYRRQGQSSHPGTTNHSITSSTCGSTNISFNFIKIDDCLSSPCQHGGTCIDLIADYGCICPADYDGKNCEKQILPTKCSSAASNGVQKLKSGELVDCWNGWRIFQRRMDGSIPDFHTKSWDSYAHGFGNLTKEFWLGLRKLHIITRNGGCRLRVDLQSFQNDSAYAEYSNFSVANEADYFRLTVGGYSGTAGDSLTGNGNPSSGGNINGMKFTTLDKDNDRDASNCAKKFVAGGWWHNRCFEAAPNGMYGKTRPRSVATQWNTFKRVDPMKFIRMGVRCD